MIPSVGGLLVFAALLLLGRYLGSALLTGTFAALPFGSTAVVVMTSLGGSSPLVYVPFAALVVATTLIDHRTSADIRTLFADSWIPWVLLALLVYGIGSAVILPRLFAGQTTIFVASPTTGVAERPLQPVAGNITQTAYFSLGILLYFAVALIMLRERSANSLKIALIAWSTTNAALGLIDWMGKLAGAGDILQPIRTASYTYLVEVEFAGFWRIAGGFSEASAFGAVTLSCLAFSYTYWRITNSRLALYLTGIHFVLLLLSTSSTAYAGFALVAPIIFLSYLSTLWNGLLRRVDVAVAFMAFAIVCGILVVYLMNDRFFDPVVRLFDAMIFNKAQSESAIVRHYWNERSLEALIDTSGLGVGLGSSRASSWLVAVISQIGVVGSLLMAALVAVLLIGGRARQDAVVSSDDPTLIAARMAALASLAAAMFSSGAVDPGLLFFAALSGVTVPSLKRPMKPARTPRAHANRYQPGTLTLNEGA